MAAASTTQKGLTVVFVHFTEPTEGADPDDGETFAATRHRVVATAVHPGGSETMFVDEGGAVVARWPTDAIERITWPVAASSSGLNGSGKPAFRSKEWIAAQRETNPRAFERWDSAEAQQLIDEFHAGRTADEMAKQHGRGTGAIMHRLISQELVAPGTLPEAVGRSPNG